MHFKLENTKSTVLFCKCECSCLLSFWEVAFQLIGLRSSLRLSNWSKPIVRCTQSSDGAPWKFFCHSLFCMFVLTFFLRTSAVCLLLDSHVFYCAEFCGLWPCIFVLRPRFSCWIFHGPKTCNCLPLLQKDFMFISRASTGWHLLFVKQAPFQMCSSFIVLPFSKQSSFIFLLC